jgi:electron transfer flavoprotein alpha subunit
MSGVLVLMEQSAGAWHAQSREALAAAQRLGAELALPVSACVWGDGVTALATELSACDLKRVIALNHALLADYTADGAVAALSALVDELQPDYVVLPHTYRTRDFAARLAARRGRGLIGDVTAFHVENGVPLFTRQLWQAKLNGTFAFETPAPNFVSVQAGAFSADGVRAGAAEVVEQTAVLSASDIRQQNEAPFRESTATVDLGAAERIVAVGRGLGEQANLALIEELATALGAEVAASRPACDAGWLGSERQVGSSGQTVAPRLYVAIGISGAIQHIVGMKGARTIVAINRDSDAPIFEIAHYGIVGDLAEVVPALIERLGG